MTKGRYALLFIFSLAIFAWIGSAHAQEAKTIKLPNGEEVIDIRGEWNEYVENYGPWSQHGKWTNILNITMEGNSFIGTITMANGWDSPGDVAIRGELDKDGIKWVWIMSTVGGINAKGQISEDGNKIIIDDGKKARVTLTRK
jgi:hypothetical protein